jgi:hypothetical protein
VALITQRVAAGTGSVALVVVPPGPCQVTIFNAGSVTAWVAAGTAAASTTAGAMPITAGAQVSITAFQGSLGSPLQVISPGGTNTSLGYTLSTAVGGTGP